MDNRLLRPGGHMRRAARARAAILAVAAAACLAAAAARAGDDTPLSLDAAVRLAESAAPSLAARAAALEAANQAIGPAGALPDPEFVAGVDNLPVTGADAFSATRDFMTMRKVGFMQTFTRQEKREQRTRRAQAEAERQRALLGNEHLALREATAKAWVACWSAEQGLAALESLRANAQAQVAAAAAALTAGRASAADAIAAQAAQGALEDRIAAAQRDVADARADLARWLPDAGERALGSAPDWSDLGADPDAIAGHAARHRELVTYDALALAAAAEIELARAEKRPDWSVEFDVAQRGPRYSNMVSLEVRVPLPLFASSRQDPLIAAKRAAAAQIDAERSDALRMHTAELRKTVAAWRSALDRTRRYERELLPLADARAQAALGAYRGGRGDLAATLAAFDNAIEQRVAYHALRGALGEAWAALRFAFAEER